MQQKMRLVLAGGGTGGHIVPNVALIQELRSKYKKEELDLLYIGGRKGMEKKMILDEDVMFAGIYCGKIRRYFSWSNFVDMLKVPIGIIQSFFVILSFKPTVIFCKGGYVSFPVAIAGWMAKVPVVLHESDVIPGLANKMAARFSTKICVSFEESKKFFPADKVVLTGNPVRKNIADGDKNTAVEFTGLKENLPVLLVMGGSQGADFINNLVWDNLNELLSLYQVVHICGAGKVKNADSIKALIGEDYESLLGRYKAFEYVGDEMKDLYKLCDLVVSRSGAMTLAELAVVNKPAILIPLSKEASRGDQIDNAIAYCSVHKGVTFQELKFSVVNFFSGLENVRKPDIENNKYSKIDSSDATNKIITLLEEL